MLELGLYSVRLMALFMLRSRRREGHGILRLFLSTVLFNVVRPRDCNRGELRWSESSGIQIVGTNVSSTSWVWFSRTTANGTQCVVNKSCTQVWPHSSSNLPLLCNDGISCPSLRDIYIDTIVCLQERLLPFFASTFNPFHLLRNFIRPKSQCPVAGLFENNDQQT